uniref:Uracil phosphoribosyltransferase n=1 Tax=Polysiphonia scopulorum TaxID=257860 RepID=A0A1Z1MIM0_9FLOR|nr:uracil phosphoribosyltransferase [Polysiphonia scopulorum]ARW65692.1 uracil phosphoribosyltransferase [Polysiphonia scopulorum]
MQLNIYKISHPIIQLILNDIKNHNKKNEKNYYYKYIGFLIIYEMLRKYIQTKHIYIKLIDNVKSVTVHNCRKRYLILTDISKTYDMIADVKVILPNIEVINVNYKNLEEIEYSIKNLQITEQETNIFIIDKITISENIIKLITYLNHKHYISISNITIGCITCYHETLNQISNHYPELNIYTTDIIK